MAIDAISLLEALKEEYNDAIDNVISRITEGEFDGAETMNHLNSTSKPRTISDEDARMLRELQNS